MTLRNIFLIVAGAALLALTSCRSSRSLPKDAPVQPRSTAADYTKTVTANAQQARALTARVKVRLETGGKSLSCNGSLRMKRGEVVQLSLTVLGMEVGRLEFAPDGVLVLDRFNKQYVRAAYADLGFLAHAGLDFYALQALFWNELFVPGVRDVATAAQRFTLATHGEHTLLSLSDAPALNYGFLTVTRNGLIDRVTVEGKPGAPAGRFEWRYGDFATVGGRPFPATMSATLTGVGRDVALSLSLSRIGNDADWETRTQVSPKYKKRSADDIFRELMNL